MTVPEEFRYELEHVAAWTPNISPPALTDDERERVHQLLEQYAGEREERVAAELARVERYAFGLGTQVARYELTLADADRRIARFINIDDDEMPIGNDGHRFAASLIPYAEARVHARAAFAKGMRP